MMFLLVDGKSSVVFFVVVVGVGEDLASSKAFSHSIIIYGIA